MRILYCNKYNHPFSGTEVYLFGLMDLMRSQGHEAALFSMADPRGQSTPFDQYFVPHVDFKKNMGLWSKARRTVHAIYSADARRRIRAMIAEFQPDIAHVRNIYHHLSPSILWELRAQGVPVVYHINDFKLLCPSYNLVSQGDACEACKAGSFLHVLTAKCYPGSRARMVLMTEAYAHQWLGTYRKCVDLFLAPSEFVRDKFIEHGWDATKFEVLPHFQKIAGPITPSLARDAPVLYFGRLSQEKGVADLLRAIQLVPGTQLVVAGDGPQRIELQALTAKLALTNVEFVGHIQGSALEALIARSRFTVLPSHAYETMGKSILESYAAARPVIASDLGSRRELIHDGETGILYPPGDIPKLAEAIHFLVSMPDVADKMGRAGQQLVQQRHTPEAHYQALLRLYGQTIAAKKSTPVGRVTPTPPAERRRQLALAGTAQKPLVPSSMPQLRVAFLGGRGVVSKYSGIEAYYEEVGKQLAQMNHEVTIYCRTYFTPPVAEYNGMRLVRLPTIRSKHWETFVHTLLSTLHVMTQPCDIVHYHALGPALFSFLPRLLGKKTVVTVQGLDWQRKKWGRVASFVLRVGERASVYLPNKTMVVSRALQHHYREQYGVETCYVPNGSTLRERRAPKKIFAFGLDPAKYILFLGRFSPEKGCHVLVKAYEQLDTNVKLVMAGASSYCDGYCRELRAHASDRIKILDWVAGDVLDELLTNAMMFVLPSDMEGLSLALLEAMGAGLCVLASDVPENCELVTEAGFTFKRGDSSDLAEKLNFLIANPEAREAAGQAAKVRIGQHYLWPAIAREIEGGYFRIIGWQPHALPAKDSATRAIPSVADTTELAQRKVG